MKILYHHRTRGTDAQRVHILQIVNAFRELGHEVEIASLVETEQQNVEREAAEASWKKWVRKMPFAYEAVQLAYNVFGFPWLVKKILSGRFDFIYERYSLFCFCGVLAARLTGRKIILEVNSPFALEQAREKDIRAAGFANWMERLVCNWATKVIVVSGPLRRIMEQNGIRSSKLVLIPNGVNLKQLGDTSGVDEVKQTLGIGNRVVIGFVGWFKRWHGLEFLIETYLQSGLRQDEAVLMLVGDGPATPELKEIVAQAGGEDRIIFTGGVPHESISAYLNTIDIAVQPAANEYCCPMKVIEYMGVAKAIIAPRQENITELLNEDTALLFEPGNQQALTDALLRTVRDRGLRKQLGENALAQIHSRGMLWLKNADKVVRLMSAQRTATVTPDCADSSPTFSSMG
jgi:glycosyltransferase involved in cell wall biosynthesis